MGKPSMARQRRHARRRSQRKLRGQQRGNGIEPVRKATLPNRTSPWQTREEEVEGRRSAVEGSMQVLRQLLPGLLHDLAKIPDPRNPKKTTHKMTVLLLYGLLAFVFQYASRREAGKEMSRPVFREHLQALFPELASLPHQDTLYRLLERIDVQEIENAQVKVLRRLMRKKKFTSGLVKKRYLVAVDGTWKSMTRTPLADEQLSRKQNGSEEYYVFVLEAKLILADGRVLPLLSEFLDNTVDEARTKQDCESKGFARLAGRLKKAFPRLPITLLLDGLYANGPVIARCRRHQWDYLIVLKDESLPSVWNEAKALMKWNRENHASGIWKGRRQEFRWANDIEYTYRAEEGNKRLWLHVVVCEESWEEVDENAKVVTKTSRHAWVSREPLDARHVWSRCNDMARRRWGIENDILKEKKQGYAYEHVFAYDWNAMRGYHYVMHLAHLVNELAAMTRAGEALIAEHGIRGWIRLVRETIAGPWLDLGRIAAWRERWSPPRFG